MKTKLLLAGVLTLVIAGGIGFTWNKLASTTKIGLLNFQPFQATSIIKANEDAFIRYELITTEQLDKLDKYDFVLAFGMGLHLTPEEREGIESFANKQVPIMVHAATNPENKICSLDSIQQETITNYLRNGNKKNYRNMARYIRQSIDKKTFFVQPADSVVESASDVLYHLDEELSFKTVAEYENYLKLQGFYQEGGAKVAIVGGLNDPFSGNRENIDSMIVVFQQAGFNVYPVSSAMKRLDFLKEIQADAVVYYAHGRLAMGQADAAVNWLTEKNIPIFSPLTVLQTEEEWTKDPMGMSGGFMSQSVVMPELDGAIYPYVVNAQELDKDGLYLFKALPHRLRNFTQIINNFISLQRKKNTEKKVAIYYFKGAGQETLTAQGLETVSALYNLLKRLRAEGYQVKNLPGSESEFEKLLMTQGAVLNTYAEGSFEQYLKTGKPALIEKASYELWLQQALSKENHANLIARYGEAPGSYMRVDKDGKSYLAVARIDLGNIALLPQPMAALGDDAFAIIHGAKEAPPHTYVGAYLWSRYAFKADALLHFGTHGSLEFTPQKQLALSSNDWPDCLVGTIPHFYYYTIGNVGESMMAKRRSYATTISYLTPPFMESDTRSQFKTLQAKIQAYYQAEPSAQAKASLSVKKTVLEMGLHRELRLDSLANTPYSTEDIERIDNFAEEIANEKMTGQLYVTGVPYPKSNIHSSVLAMSADPIAYSLAALDKQNGRVSDKQLQNKSFFTQKYLNPAKELVHQVLNGKRVDSTLLASVAHLTTQDLAQAKAILTPPKRGMGHGKPKDGEAVSYTKEQKSWAQAVDEFSTTVHNITAYKEALEQSPEREMQAILNALSGGYVAPSSGGDAVANPRAVPTGKNLYAVNAEATPSEAAWEKGVSLVQATLQHYQKQHGSYPKKVSYTFWSSEFVESEGATIAQALYMLGVEPVRDAFGRVSTIRLIPSETLGRPRIDVVVQTSGQFRDLAASRLTLITQAVEMAATSSTDRYENWVAQSSTQVEQQLVEQGIPPASAREMSTQRVFGGINGMYGTSIQGMVKSGDKWESEQEIAETYLHNMGAVYGSDTEWGQYKAGLLRAVLHHTDVVVQPRQSNTWGALSLDHVFEFMGGLNLAVREVTGKDPDTYFADYRNRNKVKMQELKEAIGVESRATVFNPAYIKEVMKGKASSAAQITEVVTNTYAWNVMKPDVVDKEMWDKLYEVYVKDSHNLGVQGFFKEQNPAAMQEITAVMLETVRKGMWQASPEQIADIAAVHTQLVNEFGSSGSGFSGENAKLQDFIAQNVPAQQAKEYKQQLQSMKSSSALQSDNSSNGMLLKKDTSLQQEEGESNGLNGLVVVSLLLLAFVGLLVILKKKRTNRK